MTYRRAYIPGIVAQARGLRGPKGDPGDITLISSALSTYLGDYAITNHTHGLVSGYNITATSSSNGLTLSVNVPEAAANAVRTMPGGYVSLSTAGANTTVSVTGLQPAGAYLTTAALSDHSHTVYLTTAAPSTHTHGTVSTASTIGPNVLASSSSNGFTLYIPDYLTTGAETWHSHTDAMAISERPNYFYTSANTFANSTHIHGTVYSVSTSGTNIKFTSSSSGLTVAVPNYVTAIGANVTHTHGSVLGQNITAVSASSGLTLSVVNPIPLTSSNNFIRAWELDTAGNTDGTLSSLQGSKLYLAGGDNITLSGNSNTIWFDAAGGGAGNLSLGVLNDTYSSTDIVLYDGPQIAFSGKSNITIYTAESSDTIGTYFMFSVADPGAAANEVLAGSYVDLSTDGVSTTVNVTGLIPTADSTLFLPQASISNLFLDANSTLLQSAGPYLTTAALSNHTHGTFNTTGVTGSLILYSSSSNGFTLGVPPYLTTETGGDGTGSWATYDHTHGSVPSMTGAIGVTSNSSAWSISIPSFLTTGAISDHTHGAAVYTTNINATSVSNALSLSVPMGSLYFSNIATNNITFGSAASGSSTTITAIAGGGTGAGGGGIAFSLGTAGTSGTKTLVSGGTLYLEGSSNITVFQNGSSIGLYGPELGDYMGTGVSTSGAITASGNTAGISITSPPLGYLYFCDILGFSWSSSTSGVSTSISLVTA